MAASSIDLSLAWLPSKCANRPMTVRPLGGQSAEPCLLVVAGERYATNGPPRRSARTELQPNERLTNIVTMLTATTGDMPSDSGVNGENARLMRIDRACRAFGSQTVASAPKNQSKIALRRETCLMAKSREQKAPACKRLSDGSPAG